MIVLTNKSDGFLIGVKKTYELESFEVNKNHVSLKTKDGLHGSFSDVNRIAPNIYLVEDNPKYCPENLDLVPLKALLKRMSKTLARKSRISAIRLAAYLLFYGLFHFRNRV